MAVTAYFSFSSPTWNNRAPDCGGTRFFRSDTTAEMNALTNLMNGDRAFCIDSKLSYGRTGGAWVVEVSDAIASILIDDTLAALDVGTITDGQYLKRSGLTIASVDVQALLDAKVPTSRTVNGFALSANVTITTITGNAGTATALATPRTINGVSFDGTANITVTAAGSTLSDNVPTSKLNSGSGADATTFWRGDGSWQVPAGGSGLSQPQVMARAQFAGAF